MDRDGHVGSRPECLAHIKQVWTDMRPASLRRAMAELAGQEPPPAASPRRRDLVDVLSDGDHAVEIGLCPERSVHALAAAIDRGLVHVKFTGTRGGTEIGVPLDRARCEVDAADLRRGTGAIHLEGELTLDLMKVRCVVNVELATLAGSGHLIRVAAT